MKEENKVCGTIFVPKRGEVIWEWRNFCDLHTACPELLGSEVRMAVMFLDIYCRAWTQKLLVMKPLRKSPLRRQSSR
jgi:hypothetical protein